MTLVVPIHHQMELEKMTNKTIKSDLRKEPQPIRRPVTNSTVPNPNYINPIVNTADDDSGG